MKIKLNSVLVDDQDKALKFYTEILGFIKNQMVNRCLARRTKWHRISARTRLEFGAGGSCQDIQASSLRTRDTFHGISS